MQEQADSGALRAQAAVPPPIDYNPEHRILWVDNSRFPLSIEALIALTWISMVACLPLITFGLESGKLTKTRIALVVIMWIVLLGGAFLFTNVLLFQSVHFDTIRSLTLVECVYFMCQVLTTVGYGDITPAKPRGQVFVALYVIFCMLVLGYLIGEVFNLVSLTTNRSFEDIQYLRRRRLSQSCQRSSSEKDLQLLSARRWMVRGLPPLPWTPLWRSALVYHLLCLAGVVFFVLYPGEGKTWLQGIYMSVITLSTVGFGAVTPVTEGGKVFGAFWMFFGSTALVGLIGSFTSLMAAVKAWELHDPSAEKEHHQKMLKTLPEQLGKAQFLRFGLLHTELVPQEDLEQIEEAFYRLKPSDDGTISKETLREFFHVTG